MERNKDSCETESGTVFVIYHTFARMTRLGNGFGPWRARGDDGSLDKRGIHPSNIYATATRTTWLFDYPIQRSLQSWHLVLHKCSTSAHRLRDDS
jgi:hypothetical protein